MHNGIIYIVTGKKDSYIKEFKQSYNSLRKHYSGEVSLITDREIFIEGVNTIIVPSQLKSNRSTMLLNKPRYLGLTPYKKTIFLDTDTHILDNFSELFELLDYFDFCATVGPMDYNWPHIDDKELVGFLPFNTGVLGYNSTSICSSVFNDWFDLYQQKLKDLGRKYKGSDQTPFNEAILKSHAYVCTLPNNYNLRTPAACNLTKGKVKIVHDRWATIEFLNNINKVTEERCITGTNDE